VMRLKLAALRTHPSHEGFFRFLGEADDERIARFSTMCWANILKTTCADTETGPARRAGLDDRRFSKAPGWNRSHRGQRQCARDLSHRRPGIAPAPETTCRASGIIGLSRRGELVTTSKTYGGVHPCSRLPNDHTGLMDAAYGRQWHVYDFTRKYRLPSCKRLIADLACGTRRNPVKMAKCHLRAQSYNLDARGRCLRACRPH